MTQTIRCSIIWTGMIALIATVVLIETISTNNSIGKGQEMQVASRYPMRARTPGFFARSVPSKATKPTR